MASVASTRDHNVDILIGSGFKKFSNTTVFHKGELSLLSPAVAESSSGTYWFDLRKVNLERLSAKSFLLVRIVPDLFIFQSIDSIAELLSPRLMDNRPHSGDVWGIKMDINKSSMSAQIYNLKDSCLRISVELLTSTAISKQLQDFRR